MYVIYVLDFQRPASVIRSRVQPASNAKVAAPVRNEWALLCPLTPQT